MDFCSDLLIGTIVKYNITEKNGFNDINLLRV